MMIALAPPPPLPTNPDSLISLLRQKPPFLYVDKITELKSDYSGVSGEVTFAQENRYVTEPYPDVLMLEAMAQLSSILLRFRTGSSLGGVLVAIESVEFSAPLDPHIPARIEIEIRQANFPVFTLHGSVSQHGCLLCQTTFSTKSNAGATL